MCFTQDGNRWWQQAQGIYNSGPKSLYCPGKGRMKEEKMWTQNFRVSWEATILIVLL